MKANQFNTIIIGSGPGGYVCAIRSAQLGFKTAIVERDELGGICLNWGCIPTKALLRSAEVFNNIKNSKDYGISVKTVEPDIQAIVKRSRDVASRLNSGVGYLMKKNNITVIKGTAKINPDGKGITVNGDNSGEYIADNIIIATGARPRLLPGLKPNKKQVWTYFEALVADEIPKSMLVVGSGAIGVEFASFYNALGSKVTVIEMADRILPSEDKEISSLAHKALEAQGITFFTNSKIEDIKQSKTAVTADFSSDNKDAGKVTADVILLAVGVVGNTEDIGLEQLGIANDNGIIMTDGFGRTNVDNIYAIGDVAGSPMLAHKAEHEGIICIEKIAGNRVEPLARQKIPGCTYCHPQIASVGLSEEQAKHEGYDIRVGRFKFSANGKAIALGDDFGLVKTIFAKDSGELLGAHLIGPEVTELIHSFVIAMNCETTEHELIHSIFPHPTLSEAIHESVFDAYDRVIHF